jgi:hypothetical protein
MREYVVIEELYTVCQHSMPFLLSGPTQFLLFRNPLATLLWFLIAIIPPATILFLAPETAVISFLAGRKRLFELPHFLR